MRAQAAGCGGKPPWGIRALDSLRLLPHSGADTYAEIVSRPAQAVFLHTAWRSGGTWLWSRCRESAHVRAFYEPLHEQLASLRRSDICALRPQSWHSNHSDTPPYFEEYRNYLRPGGRGVDGYRQRFALTSFFLMPDEEDAELEAYVDGLIDSAVAAGRMPVLKFCRSLGRVGWFERHFPHAFHAVVLRDPLGQWSSSRRLLKEQRNRYFVVAPMLVLARNARHPLVRDTTAALGVHLPSLHSSDMAYGVEKVWRHVKQLDDDQLYRGFLAFWTACAVRAVQGTALMIDSTAIGTDAAHRGAVETALAGFLGERIQLAPRPPKYLPGDGGPAVTAANCEAAAVLHSLAGPLSPDRLDLVLRMLGQDRHAGAARKLRLPPSPACRPAPVRRRSWAQRQATLLFVVAARVMHRLRRLHGRLTRVGDPGTD